MPHRYVLAALVLLLAQPVLAQSSGVQRTTGLSTDGVRIHTAARVTSDIRIDGVLDEADWAQVEPATDFVQFDPQEGAPATQRTEARILYGASAIYVGAMLYDDPDEMKRLLETFETAKQKAADLNEQWEQAVEALD